MAFTYGFYNSKNKDRRYNADQMSQLFDGILNDGVFNNVGELMMVVPGTGLQVLVKSGRAWFNSTWSYNDAAYPLNLSTPDVAVPRIDAVVLEVDHTETVRRNRLLVVKGLAASNPEKPTLTNTDLIHQHPLAYVTLRPGAESISSGDIEIMVGKDECPFVTGILKTASLEDLYDDWNNQFTTWFDDIKSQLEGDVATNLLNEINERVKIADKASTSEVTAGTNDDKWVTPKGVAAVAGKVKDSSSNALITTRSLFTGYELRASYYNPDGITDENSFQDDWFIYRPTYSGSKDTTVGMKRYIKTTGISIATQVASVTFNSTSSGPGRLYSPDRITSVNNCGAKLVAQYLNNIYDSSRNTISLGSNKGDNFITSNYQGYFDVNSGVTNFTVKRGRRGQNITSDSTWETFNVRLQGGSLFMLGIYNDIIWVGTDVNNTEFHIHKIDIGNKSYQANIAVLNLTGHTTNISFSGGNVEFKSLYYSGNYAYILPVVHVSSTGKYIIGTKVIQLNMTNGVTNWDTITNFFEHPVGFSVIYIGSSGSKSYLLAGSLGGLDYAAYVYLFEFDESSLTISRSTVKFVSRNTEFPSGIRVAFQSSSPQYVPQKITAGMFGDVFYLSYDFFINVKLSEVYYVRQNPSSVERPMIIGNYVTKYFTLFFYSKTSINNVSHAIGYGGPAQYDIIKT